jgi:hypothetical protein
MINLAFCKLADMFAPRRGIVPTFLSKLTFTQILHLLKLSAPLIYLKTTTKNK